MARTMSKTAIYSQKTYLITQNTSKNQPLLNLLDQNTRMEQQIYEGH